MNNLLAQALPPLIPRDLLFGNPERIGPRISPDGSRLAYLAPFEGVMNIFVRTIGLADDRLVTRSTDRPIRVAHWDASGNRILYVQDHAGDENYHVFAVDLNSESNSIRDLTPFPGARASITAIEFSSPDSLLLSTNHRDASVFDVYRCRLDTGELELVATNPGNIVGWVADAKLTVRAAVASQPGGGSLVLVRETSEAEWRVLLDLEFGDAGFPLAFDASGEGLYVVSDKGVNTQRLYHANVATGDLKLIQGREDVDFDSAIFDPSGHSLRAVGYNRDRLEWVGIDDEMTADLERLRNVIDGDFSILSQDEAGRFLIVAYNRDNGPTPFYVYDRASSEATVLFTNRPALESVDLSRMEPFEIVARDGRILPSYLTTPESTDSGAGPSPLVLLVHGGPWARDSWGFSPYNQWLANRGYAVLQVNFRGSAGFGKGHLNAGNREWGAKMHDDLIDAVDWAIARGVADPDRVAIFGGSYGGYATLAGLTFTPTRFACGVDLVGPSSLLTLLNSIPPYWAPLKAQFVQRVGDPDTEPEFLKSRSPLFFADKIVRPLLIAQGANDPRVKQAESDQIVESMRQNGQEVLYLLYADEGHGFARPENILSFAATAEAFLAQHLGGRMEPLHAGEEPPIVG